MRIEGWANRNRKSSILVQNARFLAGKTAQKGYKPEINSLSLGENDKIIVITDKKAFPRNLNSS